MIKLQTEIFLLPLYLTVWLCLISLSNKIYSLRDEKGIVLPTFYRRERSKPVFVDFAEDKPSMDDGSS